MRALSRLWTGLALFACALAQNAPVAFTSVPAVVEAGSSYNITWGGGDGSPVTLTLRRGDPSDLDTIGILADGIEGDSYEWKVSKSLETASDYALQITQGQSDINWSGLFSVVGGTGSSSISYTSTTSGSSNSSMTTTNSALPTIGGTNSSMTTTMSGNQTMTSSSSSGRTTLTTTPATHPVSGSGSIASATNSASDAQDSSAPNSNTATLQMRSPAAFVMSVLGAVLFLQ